MLDHLDVGVERLDRHLGRGRLRDSRRARCCGSPGAEGSTRRRRRRRRSRSCRCRRRRDRAPSARRARRRRAASTFAFSSLSWPSTPTSRQQRVARVAHALLAGEAGGVDGRQPGALPRDDPALDHADVLVAERCELGGASSASGCRSGSEGRGARRCRVRSRRCAQRARPVGREWRPRDETRPTRSARGRRSASPRSRSPRAHAPGPASRSTSKAPNPYPDYLYYFRKCSNGRRVRSGFGRPPRTSSLRCGMFSGGTRIPPVLQRC